MNNREIDNLIEVIEEELADIQTQLEHMEAEQEDMQKTLKKMAPRPSTPHDRRKDA